ncbi:MaoC/PaaZ C-terminal domain-containing protein [Rhodococcoides kyotonense]|uniref:Acyl dehydratase n=1 Tax=Rhodococcoides kyotonense TaxID=398843 RepID=A0A239M1P9_9NOCA|nr:MaoC/PaaZ C-terminal domain-containing protein [Rhodococcus kyotonensis]SNT36646.1 Acyl dehydratase [Rhodococcus kyotonensis]
MTDTVFTLSINDELPPFIRETGLANWNRFAAVNNEFIDIHMDDDAGRAAGYDSAFGMGNLLWSYMHSSLRQWLGSRGRILAVSCQFRGPNTKGMTLTVRGSVSSIREVDDHREVTFDLWIEDQHGNKLTPGNATVALNH